MNKTIKLFNTLGGKKEVFKPLRRGKINLFVCGPTVYDFSHIGHARTYIIFDCFVKYLKTIGYKVFYLQNITDIDDKIILRAKEKDVLPSDLAQAYEKEYLKDMKIIGVDSVNKYARATDHIKEIISQVERLMEKGFAYKIDDGIYFDTLKFKEYGKLSGRTSLEVEDSFSRIDYSKNKKNRGDFCLWKFRDSQDEPSWNSPFGQGRPGWHIEDTAITEKFFGAQYDIHGGGRDLLFPHHEAEVTQMESLSSKKPMAKYWLHTGFLTINGQKMSKSLNNSVLISSFIERYSSFEIRFWIAKNLWKSPLDYSESTMMEVKSALSKIEEFLRKLQEAQKSKSKNKKESLLKLIKITESNFFNDLSDDFNTPKAFATLFEFIKQINKLIDSDLLSLKDAKAIYKLFERIDKIFGIIDFKKIKKSNTPKEVSELMKKREEFRKNQLWDKADEARKEIEKYGYTVEDKKDGPILKKL
ncbi:MAG: cysteine--tRNA ligase [Candidatus Staskawiczbacteria bacterium]|nr:cysteine--tRNA ligase [Candidatus Staskawiczbacteria bacterium]